MPRAESAPAAPPAPLPLPLPPFLPLPALLPFRREQSNAGLRFGNPQFDPALLAIKRLVRDDRKTQLLSVKIQCALLVSHRNGHEFDLVNHGAATFEQGLSAVEREGMKSHKSLVHLKG